MKQDYDIAVVGSGFGGSLFATIARRLGRSVILLESSRHPRFAIGESSTPLANLLLEELSRKYELPRIAPLAKWGSWQEVYPNVTCGLKRGFSFFHHSLGQSFKPARDRRNELLVAASPHDRIADTHWYRAELDELLAGEAVREGAEFLDEVKLDRVFEGKEDVQLEGLRRGSGIRLRVKFVVDATGPRGFLHRALKLRDVALPGFPPTQALYNHFSDVRRFANYRDPESQPPYPVDDAAVHHVFEGGWIWVLRFNNGITSAGVAALDEVATKFCFEEGAPGWNRLLNEVPSIRAQFADAKPARAFVHSRSVAFRSERTTGRRWAMLPSAAGFADPLLSTGFPLNLLGIKRVAEIVNRDWDSERFEARLLEYGQQTEEDLLAASRLIAGLYASTGDFPLFSSLSLLYFAAASYADCAQRLGKPELASSFLLRDHPSFGSQVRQLLQSLATAGKRQETEELRRTVLQIIEPIDIVGLGIEARNNWYPVDAEDLLAAADKLESNRDEIHAMLQRAGFWERSA